MSVHSLNEDQLYQSAFIATPRSFPDSVFGGKDLGVAMNVGTTEVLESVSHKLLGDFSQRLNQLCMKASQQLCTTVRATNCMDEDKLIMKSFIMSQFSYCSLIWIFNDRTSKSLFDKIHERALRIACRDTGFHFDELLAIDT